MSMEQERETVEAMIRCFCAAHHGPDPLCTECDALLTYANKRLDACKFGEEKPVCSKCSVHCYRPDMREKIRQVMAYAGPRMLLRHPVRAIRHLARMRKHCPGLE